MVLLIVFEGVAGSEKFAEISLILKSGTFRSRRLKLIFQLVNQGLSWLYIAQRQHFIGSGAVACAADHAGSLKNFSLEP